MGLPDGAESETVKVAFAVPASPSGTETSPTETVGIGSSSTMVPVPLRMPGATFDRLDRFTANVSSNSFSEVSLHGDVHGLRRLAGRERQRARHARVVAGRRRGPVGGRVVHADRLARRSGERHGERRRRGARVALGGRNVVDARRSGQRRRPRSSRRPGPSAIVAFAGFERFARNVSSNSSVVSPTTGTVNVRVTTPG